MHPDPQPTGRIQEGEASQESVGGNFPGRGCRPSLSSLREDKLFPAQALERQPPATLPLCHLDGHSAEMKSKQQTLE